MITLKNQIIMVQIYKYKDINNFFTTLKYG